MWRKLALSATGAGLAAAFVAVAGYRSLTRQLAPPMAADSAVVIEAQQRAMRQYFWPEALERHSMRRVFSGGTDTPLAVGLEPPPLAAGGWFNGPPPTAEELKGRVVVIDVWDNRCTMCGEAAPALVSVYEKYKDRGVIFVGLSVAESVEAERFVTGYHLSWPNGYEATEIVRKLVGAAPTLFVVGADGRIVWHDDRARLRHDINELGPQLDDAIDQALRIMESSQPGV